MLKLPAACTVGPSTGHTARARAKTDDADASGWSAWMRSEHYLDTHPGLRCHCRLRVDPRHVILRSTAWRATGHSDTPSPNGRPLATSSRPAYRDPGDLHFDARLLSAVPSLFHAKDD